MVRASMTANLRVDFFADFATSAARQLAAWGHAVPSGSTARDIVIQFVNLQRRRIEPRPRTVHVAAELVVPTSVHAGFELVKKTAETGGDLNLHLSKTVKTDADYDDPMLNDWGIHHLHLGASVMTAGKSRGLIQRTKELLFAIVRDDSICFVAVGDHDDWARERLLEIAYANWPHLFGGKMIHTRPSRQTLTDEDRLLLREHGIVAPTEIGGIVMFSPGGGYTTTGRSARVLVTVSRIMLDARNYEMRFQAMASQLIAKAEELGVKEDELEFHYIGAHDGAVLVKDERTKIIARLPIPGSDSL